MQISDFFFVTHFTLLRNVKPRVPVILLCTTLFSRLCYFTLRSPKWSTLRSASSYNNEWKRQYGKTWDRITLPWIRLMCMMYNPYIPVGYLLQLSSPHLCEHHQIRSDRAAVGLQDAFSSILFAWCEKHMKRFRLHLLSVTSGKRGSNNSATYQRPTEHTVYTYSRHAPLADIHSEQSKEIQNKNLMVL